MPLPLGKVLGFCGCLSLLRSIGIFASFKGGNLRYLGVSCRDILKLVARQSPIWGNYIEYDPTVSRRVL